MPAGPVLITGSSGRSLTVRDVERDGDEGWYYWVDLAHEAGTATSRIWDYGNATINDAVTALASSWQGFEGERSWGSIENQLEIRARHDGLGTVMLTVTLQQVRPPEWSASAVLGLGAGAHLESAAQAVDQLFSGDG